MYWLQDQAGDEHGHFVAAPWAGGEPIDITPDLPAYASFAADGGADGTFATSIIGPDRVQIAAIAWSGDRPGDRPVLLDPGPGFVTNLVVGPDSDAHLVRADGAPVRVRVVRFELAERKLQVVVFVELLDAYAAEIDRDAARRWTAELERMARVGTWRYELATGTLHRSESLQELYRGTGVSASSPRTTSTSFEPSSAASAVNTRR